VLPILPNPSDDNISVLLNILDTLRIVFLNGVSDEWIWWVGMMKYGWGLG
jgi:hypothetical protein